MWNVARWVDSKESPQGVAKLAEQSVMFVSRVTAKTSAKTSMTSSITHVIVIVYSQ